MCQDVSFFFVYIFMTTPAVWALEKKKKMDMCIEEKIGWENSGQVWSITSPCFCPS